MREALASLEGRRLVVQGVLRKVSTYPLTWARKGPAILLLGIATPEGDLLADHIWVPFTRPLASLDLTPGVRMEGRGTVARYRRADGSEDFKITNLRQVRRVESLAPPSPELDLLAALRERALMAEQQAGALLHHVHRVVNPTGAKLGTDDYLASMLEARGLVWQLQQTVGELKGIALRIGTRPLEEEANKQTT